MMGYFVTGTDTGVGKTFVTSALARLAIARGHRVFAFKPIETGCEVFHGEHSQHRGAAPGPTAVAGGDGPDGAPGTRPGRDLAPTAARAGDGSPGTRRGLDPEPAARAGWGGSSGDRRGADQELLAVAAGDWQQGPLRGVYRLLQPAAPRVAAEAEGVEIDLDRISATLRGGATSADVVLVEGAGGWRVPITPTVDMAGLARLCGYPVIIVARAGLGTINHSLLTLEAVERDGLSIAALVLSKLPGDDAAFTRSNADEIQRRWPGRILVAAADSDLAPLL